jgi:hypothetical protein
VKSSSILIAVVLMVGTILAIFVHHYSKRQADRVEVQKAANTVDSGMRNEPLIALRPQVANFNAALTDYIDGGGGRRHENRVFLSDRRLKVLSGPSTTKVAPLRFWMAHRIFHFSRSVPT